MRKDQYQVLIEHIKNNKPTLESVTFIGDEKININKAKCLAEALQHNTYLKNLELDEKQLGDPGVTIITSALKVNDTLSQISLTENEISDIGVIEFVRSIKLNNTLEQICLGFNDISDRGACAFAEILKSNNSLRRFDLGDNPIGNEGAFALAQALKTNATLQSIILSGTLIDDQGGAAIADALLYNTSLMDIEVYGLQIKDKSIQKINHLLKRNHLIKKHLYHENLIKTAFLKQGHYRKFTNFVPHNLLTLTAIIMINNLGLTSENQNQQLNKVKMDLPESLVNLFTELCMISDSLARDFDIKSIPLHSISDELSNDSFITISSKKFRLK